MPPENDNGWERWRGEATQLLKDIHEDVKALSKKFEEHEKHDDRRFEEVNRKVHWWSGVVAAVVTGIGWGIHWLAKRQ